MFEKCCLCNKRAGFSQLKKSGYVHPSSIELLKLEDRWYIDRSDVWLCPRCKSKEETRDLKIIREREEQERLRHRQAEEARFYNHPGPEDAVYRKIWLWMKENVGKTAKVSFTNYEDGHYLIPAENDRWTIDIPRINDDIVCWSWSGSWSNRSSKGTVNVRLELKTTGTYPGCHTVDVSDERLVYKIGFKRDAVYDSSHDETWYISRATDDISKVTGWTTYQMELQA